MVINFLKRLKRVLGRKKFTNTIDYWENRYASGGNSGAGSYNDLAIYKASILNDFVEKNGIVDVMEFGCGDGNQLKLANYPKYIGFDVSRTAVDICRKKFKDDESKKFFLMDFYSTQTSQLTLSLDVIFHLVEDNIFQSYMEKLFSASRQYVVIYSSNVEKYDSNQITHVRQRKFSTWIEKNCSNWMLMQHIPNQRPYDGTGNTTFAEFFIYKK